MPEIAQLAAELGRDRQIARLLQAAPAEGQLADVASGSCEPPTSFRDGSVSSYDTARESLSDSDEQHTLGKAGPINLNHQGLHMMMMHL